MEAVGATGNIWDAGGMRGIEAMGKPAEAWRAVDTCAL